MSDAPQRPVAPRVTRLASDMAHYPAAYRRGVTELLKAGSSLRSPVFDARRSSKPSSSTPSEPEAELRIRLVLSAQRLATAIRYLVTLGWWDIDGWLPDTLVQTRTLVREGDWVLVDFPICDEHGNLQWKDAGDVNSEPPDTHEGARQLQGILRDLHGQEWDDVDEFDLDTVRDALHEAEEAVRHLRKAGVWSVPAPDAPPKVCIRQGCWKSVGDGLVCNACRQKEWRERQKGVA